MNLTLRLADTTLLLSLADQHSCSIELTDMLRTGLESCCETYAALRQSGDNAALLALGERLAELVFSSRPELLRQWLDALGTRQLTLLAEDATDELILRLPWEILVADGQFLTADTRPFEVIRRTGPPAPTLRQPQYRDLTLLFMAADPELSSNLSYEAEERAIFAATRTCRNLNLIVDESGSLEGLRSRLLDTSHCDVLHLSCHGSFEPERGFVLHLEDRQFGLLPATAHDFIPLRSQCGTVFLSACHSAEHRDNRSLLIELGRLGIANLVGWDGAVADEDATRFAAHLYKALQVEETVPAACALARQAMLREGCTYWHSARCCLGPEGGLPLISRRLPKSPGRRGLPCHELLDQKKKELPVASRETFVGRRLQTKKALQAFAERRSVLLYGIGGTGKSSLAARIVDRLEPRCKAAVLYRHYQAVDLLEVLQDAARGREIEVAALLDKVRRNPGSLKGILLDLLEGIFHEQPIVLVADDLEQHILQPLPAQGDKAEVRPEYQALFTALIEAFAEADTDSRLLLTSRCCFCLHDRHGEDLSNKLKMINVPDMTLAEQEKHWLALVQRDGGRERDKEQDARYLERIFAAAQGNPGLQAVLFQPLLKGELAALDRALERIAASQVKLTADSSADEVDKYFQRIALEVYSQALRSSERETLRLLTLFDFPVPRELLLQAGLKAGIADPAAALQRLDNFGLLSHWQGRDVDGHISCYGLARKVVEPLGRKDRNDLAKICAPLLWRIWFKDFLDEYAVPETETLKESVDFIYANHFPQKYKGELPLSGETDQRRIAALHRLCIRNCLADWEKIGFNADVFISYLELSLSLHVFEKLRVSGAALDGLSTFQFTELYKIFDEERGKFQTSAKEYPQDIIRLMFSSFSGRGELLRQAYLLFFGDVDKPTDKILQQADLADEEKRLNTALQLAKTDEERANICRCYAENFNECAIFLKNEQQDYAAAEKMYRLALKADPNHAHNLGWYADFLTYQKKDYAAAGAMFQRAVEADPKNAAFLGYYAAFLWAKKQDYAAAEAMFQQAVEADPKNANNLGNYAVFLKNQKKDYSAAEAMYQRAVEADPNHARNLGNYAIFLDVYKKDYAAAEKMYQRALESTPEDANSLGNYARLLFVRGERAKSLELLERAEQYQESEVPELAVELAFYRYAHCQPQPISPLKQLLLDGVRSLGWNLADNVRRAEQDGHPNPALLAALAKVISDDQPIETLAQFEEWSNAND